MNISKLYLIIAMLTFSSNLSGQSLPIIIDGEFSDWENISFVYKDSVGDAPSGGVDFGGMKVWNNGQFLYLYIELNYEVILQSDFNATLYLDTDGDNSTGLSINGIGAELKWNFAAKSGTFYFDGNSTTVSQSAIDIVTAPTLSSETFEISLELDSKPDNLNLLFTGSDISLLIIDNDSGDVIPEPGDSAIYQIHPVIGVPIDMIGLSKNDSNFLRFLTWNVRRDDLFDSSLYEEYSRIFNAIDPEIIAFQEIYGHSPEELKTLMKSILPSEEGEEWFTSKEGNDILLASRYDLKGSWRLTARSGAFLIDLSSKYADDLLVIGVHPPCCSNDAGRQLEADAVMSVLRDALQGGGIIQLDPGTPVIFAGDFNSVGDRMQIQTMLTGDIWDNTTWGEDFAPDWDGTFLKDAVPRHAQLNQTYTWQNEFSDFSPGRLDLIIFTDSAIKLEKSYVLRTEELLPDTLAEYGLMTNDTKSASDHLPVVADFSLQLKVVAVDKIETTLQISLSLEQNYPNPFNPLTKIGFFLNLGGSATLSIYDTRGREVAKLLDGFVDEGSYSVTWNAENMASGIYFYRLKSGEQILIKKMLLLK